MTTSGTITFNPSITFVITSAYRKLGVINEDEQPTAGMFSDAMFAANSLIKEWQALGIHVWTEEEAIVFLQPGQVRYLLGAGSTDHSAAADAWTLGQLSASAIAGSTTVTLSVSQYTDLTIANGENIGIVLDNGPTFWTTVNGAPSGGVVTLTNPLPSSASQGNFTFAYSTPITRPLKIPSTRRLAYQGLLEIRMLVLSRQEYMDLPNKHSPGIPTQFFYAPKLNQGELFVWPMPGNSLSAARITWYRELQDFNDPANTGDIPQEWINTLTWNLAKEMGLDFSVPPPRWAIIIKQAEEKLEMAQGFDRESEPVYFGMNYDQARVY